jgi:pyruvate ferredoxin oxidoreductase gamma subunit
MLESRFHGLGGQGVVLTTHLIGKAAVIGDLWAHSFPFFTTAMRGGMVTAFSRINTGPIDQRCFIYSPNILVLFHENLLLIDDVVSGIDPQGLILVNSEKQSLDPPAGFEGEISLVNAREIAESTLGRPILSTVMAGAFASMQDFISLDMLSGAIEDSFAPDIASRNLLAAKQGNSATRIMERSTL